MIKVYRKKNPSDTDGNEQLIEAFHFERSDVFDVHKLREWLTTETFIGASGKSMMFCLGIREHTVRHTDYIVNENGAFGVMTYNDFNNQYELTGIKFEGSSSLSVPQSVPSPLLNEATTDQLMNELYARFGDMLLAGTIKTTDGSIGDSIFARHGSYVIQRGLYHIVGENLDRVTDNVFKEYERDGLSE